MRSALAVAIGLALGAAAPAPLPLPAAVDQPALITPRAGHALLLGLTMAGRRLVAVGERGVVLLSDDEGASWRQASGVPTAVTLTAVRFVSATQGWAVGHLGVILHSTDGGETWQRQLDGAQVAVLQRQAADAMPAGAARTAAVAAADQLVADGPDKPFLDVSVGADAVLAVGAYGLAVRSTDGGESWQPAAIADPQGLHLYALARTGAATLVAGEQGFLQVLRDDGGVMPVHAPDGATLFGATSLPDGTLLAFGLGRRLLRSDDGGANWLRQDAGLTSAITCAVVLPAGRIVLGSDNGDIAISDAGGRQFHTVASSLGLPITDMLVDGASLILTGPAGPRRLPLAGLDRAT